MPETMRVLRLTRLEGGALEIGEAPVPDAPGAVIIDVHAAGVAFADLLMTRGQYQFRPDPPFVPGSDIAGVVRSAPEGSGFKARRPGRRDWLRRVGGGRGRRTGVHIRHPGRDELRAGYVAHQLSNRLLRAGHSRRAAARRADTRTRRGGRRRHGSGADRARARSRERHVSDCDPRLAL
jgi:Alcohol dehydrogenase GroES-like domain